MNGNVEKEKNSLACNKFITCPHCGEQIIMVPVLSDMIEAIENHLSTHSDHTTYLKNDPIHHPKAPYISKNLAEQVLVRAAEIGEAIGESQFNNNETVGPRINIGEKPF